MSDVCNCMIIVAKKSKRKVSKTNFLKLFSNYFGMIFVWFKYFEYPIEETTT
jgi:hypothetical protein